ncbi:MAG: NUDIX domain-containing protein [Rhodobacteraceae bacterium]|nr:NUDIX domain-containing protein [Paracoccaceae bacterium]
MADLFFYGTLRHVPLLEVVLDKPERALNIAQANLANHEVYWVRDEIFPMLEEAPNRGAPGILVRGLSKADLARLEFYEGGFRYGHKPVEVALDDGTSVPAEVFFSQPGRWTAGKPWDLRAWVRDWGALSVEAAHEAMAHMGRITPDELREMFPGIRRRAQSRLAARARRHRGETDRRGEVKLLKTRWPYGNFFAVQEADLQHRRYDGTMSEVMNRAAFMASDAAVVLPYDPRRDLVLLIEQFRFPALAGGARNPWMLEPVAGLVDPGETPEQCAHREAMEEAGVALTRLEPVAGAYASSGNSTEYLHVYIGLCDLSDVRRSGGMVEEGEDIRVSTMTYAMLMEHIDACVIRDMPLISCGLWLARHRERLRGVPDTA